MKYKDNRFVKYQEKQRDGEFDDYWSRKSDRQIRREKEHRFSTFYQKFLIGRIDKYWWKHLRDSDKEKIMSLYSVQLDVISTKDVDRWYSDPVFETWAEWFGYVKTTFKPNKISLREDKFKVLGI
jgi:hypothetical protein